jgi:hypothetical protein
MQRWWPVLILFLIAIGGVWFWSLGSLPREVVPQATVAETEGDVIVKSAAGEPESAHVGMSLEEGATITTGPDGKVTLDWFGEGETRLGPSSELFVRTARPAEDEPLAIRLRLESGRAWTRVMRLLEIDADLSVETNDVVATVRGTFFDVETAPGTATTIWVADSVVEAAGATVAGSADGFFIPEGSMAEFGSGHHATTTRPLSDDDRATEWFQNNREADERFRNAALPHMKATLAAERVPSEGFRKTLSEWSERMRVRFASGQRRERLSDRYLLRHLMAIRRAAEEGKSGLAYREFARMDGEMKARMEAEGSKREMRVMMQTAQRMFQDVQPASPAYRIKQQVEEWSMHAAHEPADRLYARLMMIGSRLDEAAHALDEEQPEAASQVLVLARQGLANVDRERRETQEMSTEHFERLRGVWKSLSVRADGLDARLKHLSEPPEIVVPPPSEEEGEPEAVEPTSTAPLIPVVPTSTPTVPEPQPEPEPKPPAKPVSMTLTPGVQTIGFYERVTYRAIAVYDDGLTRDVTSAARFTMSPTGYGALFDNVFSATELRGTIVITATYEEAGVPLQGQATLTIVDRNQ